MGVRVQESLSGFVASDPQLSATGQGETRLYLRVGQEQFRKLEDGSFEKTGVAFTDLVQFGKTAERTAALFRKGDVFIAAGYTRQYERTLDDGTVEHRTEFVARKLGHDAARTTYVVDRSARRNPPTAEAPVAAPTVEPAVDPPAPVTEWPVVKIPN